MNLEFETITPPKKTNKKTNQNWLYMFTNSIFRPENCPEEGLWRGATDGGKTGFFKCSDVVPYIEIGMSPGHRARAGAKLSRKGKTVHTQSCSGQPQCIHRAVVLNLSACTQV